MREIFHELDQASDQNPQKSAQDAMRPQLAKRFYKEVSVSELDDGFGIELDGRLLKTPARNEFIVAEKAVADLVANEWDAQEEHIDAANMYATRLINTAIDGIAADPQAVLEDIVKYASSDLLCYRADKPADLVDLQESRWDPVLDWVSEEYGAYFESTQTLTLVEQSRESIRKIGEALREWRDPVSIGALHTFTTLTGSVFLALAIAKGKVELKEAWELAHIDEDWNINIWGEDNEAKKRRDKRWQEIQAAGLVFFSINQK